MLGEKNWQLLDFFRHFLTSLQLLCLLHHPVHWGMLCLLDSDHLHHQSGEKDKDHDMWWWRSTCMQSMTNFRQNLPTGAEHGQNRLHLPNQIKSLPLCAWELHTPHVRRNLVLGKFGQTIFWFDFFPSAIGRRHPQHGATLQWKWPKETRKEKDLLSQFLGSRTRTVASLGQHLLEGN